MRTGFMERTGKIEEMDRRFDLIFWQTQSDEARLEATWELVVESYLIKGKNPDELRLQRSVESLKRQCS